MNNNNNDNNNKTLLVSCLALTIAVFLGKTLNSSSILPVKPRKDMNNVSYRRNTTEIKMLTEAKKKRQSTNQSINCSRK